MNWQTTAEIIFWTSFAALVYTYAGYPLLVYFVSLIRPHEIKKSFFEPKVTVLITAYNEENDIRAKLENTLLLDYPKEKLEILVASDGSTDKTDEIVKQLSESGVKLFRQEGRKGKTFTQNKAVEQATGEIILIFRRDDNVSSGRFARNAAEFCGRKHRLCCRKINLC